MCVTNASRICPSVGNPSDFFAPFPISLAYSSAAPCASTLGSVARCQIPRKMARNASDSSPAFRDSSFTPASRGLLDGEGAEVFLRLRRIELLAHHLELGVAGCRCLHVHLRHVLPRVGDQEHLLGDLLVVDVALDV